MRRIAGAAFLAFLAVVAVVVLAGCGDSKPSNPTLDDVGIDTRHPDVTITVDDQGYSPGRVEVTAGAVIRFENAGTTPHSFTSDTRFDTGRMQPGESTLLILDEPGEIPFTDLEAPAHAGTLVVRTP